MPALNVNGQYYAYGDIEARITGLGSALTAALFVGVTAINYSDKLGRSYVRGTARAPLGATSGQYEASGDIEMHKPAADNLIRGLGPLWRQTPLTLTISYSAIGLGFGVTTDILSGVYLTDLDAPNADGTESLKRKFSLFIVSPINWGGLGPGFIEAKFPLAIG
jgi:hypothetical protein